MSVCLAQPQEAQTLYQGINGPPEEVWLREIKMAGKCLVCGEPIELNFSELCDFCFELDLDKLMKKFLQMRQKEEGKNPVKAEPPRSTFYGRFERWVRGIWAVLTT